MRLQGPDAAAGRRMDLKGFLILALSEMRPVSFWYGGHPRLFCPHVVGRKRGVERAFGVQFDGTSSSGPVREPAWKCFDIAGMEGFRLIDRDWVRGEGRGPGGNTCIDEVDAVVAPQGQAPGTLRGGATGGRPGGAGGGRG